MPHKYSKKTGISMLYKRIILIGGFLLLLSLVLKALSLAL